MRLVLLSNQKESCFEMAPFQHIDQSWRVFRAATSIRQSTKGGAVDFDFKGAKSGLTAALFLASRKMVATFKLERRHIEVRLNVPDIFVSEKLADITTFDGRLLV